jgi:DnaJ-class molecular chaperone
LALSPEKAEKVDAMAEYIADKERRSEEGHRRALAEDPPAPKPCAECCGTGEVDDIRKGNLVGTMPCPRCSGEEKK